MACPVLLLGVVIVRAVVARADVVYPNLETESAFLRSYTLPIESLPGISLAAGLSGPDAAGRGCAFHQREFQTWFAITSGNQRDFMAAVQRDLESRLSAERSQIISENGSPSEGLTTRHQPLLRQVLIPDESPLNFAFEYQRPGIKNQGQTAKSFSGSQSKPPHHTSQVLVSSRTLALDRSQFTISAFTRLTDVRLRGRIATARPSSPFRPSREVQFPWAKAS
jgi:hypothetical protein